MEHSELIIILTMLKLMVTTLEYLTTVTKLIRLRQENLINQVRLLLQDTSSSSEPSRERFKSHPDRQRTLKFTELWDGEEACFVKAFRMTKDTFTYVLEAIRIRITKADLVGDGIAPETRLAICLARLTRGEYFYNIAEDYGVGETTAQQIYNETIRAIIDCLYTKHVTVLLPTSETEMVALQRQMDFPFAFAAIDGCHLRRQCPIGNTVRKDYYNFKNFYSIVLMALVDGNGKFLWCNSGMPGNCHDSTLLQSTGLWHKLPTFCHLATDRVGSVTVPSLILADNAFPFKTFIIQRFSQANKTMEQKRFNKKLSHSRVIVENAFGMLKMRFRELFRGSESTPENLKYGALAAVTLHNILQEQHGVPREDPDLDDILLLSQSVTDNHDAAARVRNSILPLVI